jgi:hypothetical protein
MDSRAGGRSSREDCYSLWRRRTWAGVDPEGAHDVLELVALVEHVEALGRDVTGRPRTPRVGAARITSARSQRQTSGGVAFRG